MLELSRAQDEEVGDGTTSVIILAGEMLVVAEPFLTRGMHPTVIVNANHRALEEVVKIMEGLAIKIDTNDKEQMRTLIRSCIGTKFSSRYGDLICDLALEAVMRCVVDDGTGRKEIDIKKYAKVGVSLAVNDGWRVRPVALRCHPAVIGSTVIAVALLVISPHAHSSHCISAPCSLSTHLRGRWRRSPAASWRTARCWTA